MSLATKFALSVAIVSPAALSLVVGPTSAQTFEERWNLVPKAHANEPPPAQNARPEPNSNQPPAAEGAQPSQNRNQPLPERNAVTRQPAQQHRRQQRRVLGRYTPPTDRKPNRALIGKASFYAYQHGKTASGSPYRRDELTAASRTLRLGTRLRVTDLKTNKSVDVTVTDRGPASKRLLLDLSLGAARVLGMSTRGIIQVRAEIIG
jgi:rare lipoprotein A (peptidoglycan hydrolase)